MIDLILFFNLPFFIVLVVPIILSEVFFKKDDFNERGKHILGGILLIVIAVLGINFVWVSLELMTAGSVIQYLLSLAYTGQFSPTIEHTVTRAIYLTIQAIPWYLVQIFGIVIIRSFLTGPEIEARNAHRTAGSRFQRWYYYYFDNRTVLYNRGVPMIAVLLIDFLLFFSVTSNRSVMNISFIHQLPNVLLQIINQSIFLLLILLLVYIPLRISKYRLLSVEDPSLEDELNVYKWIFGIVAGGIFCIFLIQSFLNDFHNFGESFYSGKVTELTFAFMFLIVTAEIVLIVIALLIPLERLGIVESADVSVSASDKISFRSSLIILIIIITSFTVTQPILATTSSYNTHKEAFNKIIISDDPITDFPVNLSQLRLVSGDLARDISQASPPSPPRPYSLTIMAERDMVGMIEGRPAWIIPMKYESQFNPDANVIAGYVRVFLDDPIPEHILIKFHEMRYGWGLNGYNDIAYQALQIMPDAVIRSDGISFIDPYEGEPAWLVRMSKFNDWGLEIPAGVLVIKGDGSHETLSVEEASLFDPEAISDSVFLSIAGRAGNYIRTNQNTGEFEFDFSSRGLFTVPTSPDRFIDIGMEYEGDDFYLRPHHYLLNEGGWYGRIYYQKTTTSNVENVVAITVENGTITIYDLRQYERGGLRGVHTPDDVMDDHEDEFEEKHELKPGESITKYRVRQPTLYKTKVENDTVLVWVSLIIYSTQGADELRGALFVDAANTRIVGYTSRSIGEASEVFKQRLVSNIEQTYLTFGTDNYTAGETQTEDIENGTVLFHDWIGQDINNWKIYVMRVWDNDEDKEWRIIVRKSEAITGQVYAMAASAMVGEYYSFSVRFDKDEQIYILYDMSDI